MKGSEAEREKVSYCETDNANKLVSGNHSYHFYWLFFRLPQWCQTAQKSIYTIISLIKIQWEKILIWNNLINFNLQKQLQTTCKKKKTSLDYKPHLHWTRNFSYFRPLACFLFSMFRCCRWNGCYFGFVPPNGMEGGVQILNRNENHSQCKMLSSSLSMCIKYNLIGVFCVSLCDCGEEDTVITS